MDNQHKLIAGYRDLTQAEISTINAFKSIERDLDRLLTAVGTEIESTASARWLAMARTHLETGLMFAIKAVARPSGGLGNPERDTAAEQHDAPMGGYTAADLAQLAAENDPEQQIAAAEAGDAAMRTRDGRPKLTAEQLAADRERHGFDPYYAQPAIDPMTAEGAPPEGELLPDAEAYGSDPVDQGLKELDEAEIKLEERNEAERTRREPKGPGAPNAVFGSGGARFVPTPDNPEDQPTHARDLP